MNSFHRTEWLSLSQTIGTLLAIVGAYGVVFLQHHLERRRREKEARRRVQQYLMLAYQFSEEAFQAASLTFDFRSNPANNESNPDRIKFRTAFVQCLNAMQGIEIRHIATARAARQVIRVRNELAYAINTIDVNSGGPGGEKPCGEEYGESLSQIVNHLRDATKELGEELAKLAG
jgi:hypothetical protein